MKVAVFSAKSYDREFLSKFNKAYKHKLTYFDATLNKDTATLTQGFDSICVFVNDDINKETIEKIAANGVWIAGVNISGRSIG